MSKQRASSLSFSLALAFALLAPQAALGGRLSDATADGAASPAVAETRAEPAKTPAEASDEAVDEAADASERPKRKGNAFTRALSAPFRALARLFGGGKSKTESAKKKKPTEPKQEASRRQSAQNVVTAEGAAPEVTKTAEGDGKSSQSGTVGTLTHEANVGPVETQEVKPLTTVALTAREPAPTPTAPAAASVKPAAAPAARATEGVRIVRPSDGEVARELQPKMWIPKIVGVPSDPISQGRALLQHGYIQEAIAELQIAATTGLPDQLSEANNLLGIAYDRLGWHRMAAEAYGRALAVSPKDHIALTNLGYSLYLADDYGGALKRLKQAAKLAPAEPVIHNNLGVVNARLGRYGDAYKSFARATNEYEAHVRLAGILEDHRKDKEALRHYEAALRLQPGASAVLERLVALYERTGARDKADTARRALGQPQKNPQKTTTGGGGG